MAPVQPESFEDLKNTWENHWDSVDVEASHRDVLAERASNNTLIYRPMVDRILAMYGAPTVLESGCGPGQWLYYVATKTRGVSVGLDLASDSLRRVAGSSTLAPFLAEGRVKLVEGDMRATPLESNSCDVIFSFGVIEHVPGVESQRAVDEFYRLLKPGGRAFITTPNVFAMHTITRPIAKLLGSWTVGYERSLLPGKICSYARKAGLKIDDYGVLDTGQLFGRALSSRLPILESLSHRIETAQRLFGFISYCVAIK